MNILAVIAPRRAGRLGFELFCYPFRTKINSFQREFLESADRFTIPSKGEVIQAYRWGNGPKNILFLHGWQSHTYRWKRYIESLDKNEYTIYSIDAPAHGLSTGKFMTVPIYCEAIRRMISQIGKIHTVVSHSLGSFTAIYTFYERPDLVPEKLVTMACPGEAREFFDFYQSKLGLTQRCLDLTIASFKEEVKQIPDFYSAPSFAEHLTIPGLIIHDEEDTEAPVKHSKAIHRRWKNTTLYITKGFGHNLRSNEIIEKTRDFIDRDPVEADPLPLSNLNLSRRRGNTEASSTANAQEGYVNIGTSSRTKKNS